MYRCFYRSSRTCKFTRKDHISIVKVLNEKIKICGTDFKSRVETIATISLWLVHPNWISIYVIGLFDVKSIVKWTNTRIFFPLWPKGPTIFTFPLDGWHESLPKPRKMVCAWWCLLRQYDVYYTLDSLDNFQRWPHISMPNVDKMFLPFVVLGGSPTIEEPIRFTFSQATRWNRHLHVRDQVQKEGSK